MNVFVQCMNAMIADDEPVIPVLLLYSFAPTELPTYTHLPVPKVN